MRAIAVASVLWLAVGAWPAAQAEPDLRSLTGKLERIEDAALEDEASAAIPEPERDARELELLDLEDEVAYLRVRTKRGLRVTAAECRVVEHRLDRLMARMGLTTSHIVEGEIPEGVELDARLRTTLNSTTASLDDEVEATTLADLRHHGAVLVPAGVLIRGRITALDHAASDVRTRKLFVRFDRLVLPSGIFEVELAVIGDVVGGLNGALDGVRIDSAGKVLTTTSGDVEIPSGTIFRLRFDSTLTLQ